MNKYVSVSYIPRATYITLMEAKKTTEDIIKITTSYQQDACISETTRHILVSTNEIVDFVLGVSFAGDTAVLCEGSRNNSLNLEKNYAIDFVNNYLKETKQYDVEKYYEMILSPTAEELKILVVVEKGFLVSVTETKEELSDFFLTLLRHSHDHKCNASTIGRKYLGLKMNEGYLDLVKLRLNRR